MSDPTLGAAATASLEAAINTALRYDPASQQKLGRLAGQSLALDIQRPSLTLCFSFYPDRVLVSQFADNPTTRLRGSLPALLNLALGEHTTLANSGVQALGSTALLTDVQNIARQLDIDWEELLTPLLGDIGAHQSIALLRTALHWGRERTGNGKRLLREFLTEELRATPSRTELDIFSRNVDQLRLQTDRAEARLRKLQRQAAAIINRTDNPSDDKD